MTKNTRKTTPVTRKEFEALESRLRAELASKAELEQLLKTMAQKLDGLDHKMDQVRWALDKMHQCLERIEMKMASKQDVERLYAAILRYAEQQDKAFFEKTSLH